MRNNRTICRYIVLLILHIYYLPHIILYLTSSCRLAIVQDLEMMNYRVGICFRHTTFSLCYHLFRNRYYRNVFYSRIGFVSKFCALYVPQEKTFYIPCKRILGGIYPAHPYATILNAKSIGRNFSFRQCTTIGNKKDGEGTTHCPTIGDNVTLGANVCIIGDINIGNNVIVGAGSVVTKDIPDDVVVVGNPARIIKRISNESL